MKIKELIQYLQYHYMHILFFGGLAVFFAVAIGSSVNTYKGERIELKNGTRVITMDGDTIEVHAYKYNPYGYKVN